MVASARRRPVPPIINLGPIASRRCIAYVAVLDGSAIVDRGVYALRGRGRRDAEDKGGGCGESKGSPAAGSWFLSREHAGA